MNKRQNEVLKRYLDDEKKVLHDLKKEYKAAEMEINKKIKDFQTDIQTKQAELVFVTDETQKALLQSEIQSKIYQKEYQQALKGQISAIVDNMNSHQYDTIKGYIEGCYESGYIGTMYDLKGQGIPIISPINQAQVIKAVVNDTKLSKPLYETLGYHVGELKKSINSEISRGIASGLSYADISRNIKKRTAVSLNKAYRIARTEGHRVQNEAANDALYKAKDKGADIVKQWDSTLDGRTRDSHRVVDGEIRELDEKFSNGLRFPGDSSGKAAEVINCRCALLQRAKWALDESELKTLKDRAEYFGLDKTENFEDFKSKYLDISQNDSYNGIVKTDGVSSDKLPSYSSRGIEIPNNVKASLDKLQDKSYIQGRIGEFHIEDLAIMSREENVEFAVVSVNNKSFLIKGKEKMTEIPDEIWTELQSSKGTLDYHSHPFANDIRPSEADLDVLSKLPWQDSSKIIDETGSISIFNCNGIIQSGDNSSLNQDELEDLQNMFNKMFGEK